MSEALNAVVYQGKPGAFSELAAKHLFAGTDAVFIGRDDYRDMFEALDSGEARAMVLPIENTTAGSVYNYYDLLLEFSIRSGISIGRELKMKIRHNLIAVKGAKIEDLREVRSHYMALGQCREYLTKLHVRLVDDFDTAGVIENIVRDNLGTVGAVASSYAASVYGAEILARDIQDRDQNYTRFLVVSKDPAEEPQTGPVKCSVVFCVDNQPGALFRTFAAFGSRELDIVRIETRPLIGTASEWRRYSRPGMTGLWDFLFYVDFRGDAQVVRNALAHLREIALSHETEPAVRVLGIYREGDTLDPG